MLQVGILGMGDGPSEADPCASLQGDWAASWAARELTSGRLEQQEGWSAGEQLACQNTKLVQYLHSQWMQDTADGLSMCAVQGRSK